MNNGTLVVRFDRVYGNVSCYPVNSAAQHFAEIAGTKTLTPRTLELAIELGFTVTEEPSSKGGFDKILTKGAP